jgi:hypothetical protein
MHLLLLLFLKFLIFVLTLADGLFSALCVCVCVCMRVRVRVRARLCLCVLVLRSEKVCAGDARQRLKITDPTSRQRGLRTSTNPKLSKNSQRENGKTWSRVPDECLTPRLAD